MTILRAVQRERGVVHRQNGAVDRRTEAIHRQLGAVHREDTVISLRFHAIETSRAAKCKTFFLTRQFRNRPRCGLTVNGPPSPRTRLASPQ
jgi:hypothetical protein